MAITKFYMPLESLKPLQESRFGVSGKSVVLCTLNAPDFFGKTKDRNRLHIMWGSEFSFTKTKSCYWKLIQTKPFG